MWLIFYKNNNIHVFFLLSKNQLSMIILRFRFLTKTLLLNFSMTKPILTIHMTNICQQLVNLDFPWILGPGKGKKSDPIEMTPAFGLGLGLRYTYEISDHFYKLPSLTLRGCQGQNISSRDFKLWLNIVDYLYYYSTEFQFLYTTYKNLTATWLWTPFTHRRRPNLNRHINTKYLQETALYQLTKFQVNRRKTVPTRAIILKSCSSSTGH